MLACCEPGADTVGWWKPGNTFRGWNSLQVCRDWREGGGKGHKTSKTKIPPFRDSERLVT